MEINENNENNTDNPNNVQTTDIDNPQEHVTNIKQSLPYFDVANQIYDKNIAQVIRNMEMNSSNLTS